ncbi:hypothetical protein GCM10028807_25060 [Spirosoma daeguense]
MAFINPKTGYKVATNWTIKTIGDAVQLHIIIITSAAPDTIPAGTRGVIDAIRDNRVYLTLNHGTHGTIFLNIDQHSFGSYFNIESGI